VTHLSKVFKPNSREIAQEEENKLLFDNTASAWISLQASSLIREVRAVKYLNPKEALCYDLITN
jgi:hypothetical protein